MNFLATLAGKLFNSIIGGIISAWESNKRDATNIEKGADKVIKGQQEDAIKRAKIADDIEDDVRRESDDDLLNSLRNRRSDRSD